METTLYVQNLKCGGCAKTITSKLNELENISVQTIEVAESAVTVSYQTEDDLITVKNTLKNNGYPEMGDESLGREPCRFWKKIIGIFNNK